MKNIFIIPGQLNKISIFLSPWFAFFSFILLLFGLWLSFFNSPVDYQQGNAVRILYIHAPSAWLSMLIYSFLAINSFFGLVYGHVTAFCLARASAPIGLTFTAICLVTGSIWGKPMWGTWWVWDARLTSVLVLFFFYIGYIVFSKSFTDFIKGEKFSSNDFNQNDITVFIGPEGGFEDTELKSFEQNNWKSRSINGNILRTETACISVLTLIENYDSISRHSL